MPNNPRNQKVKARRSFIQGQPRLHRSSDRTQLYRKTLSQNNQTLAGHGSTLLKSEHLVGGGRRVRSLRPARMGSSRQGQFLGRNHFPVPDAHSQFILPMYYRIKSPHRHVIANGSSFLRPRTISMAAGVTKGCI